MSKLSNSMCVVFLAFGMLACQSEHESKDHSHGQPQSEVKSSEGKENASRLKHDHSSHKHESLEQKQGKERVFVDYVCGMKVSDKSRTASFQEKPYYFCSDYCQGQFSKDPEGTLKAGLAKTCSCKKSMPSCDCGHCSGNLEACDCG